MIDTIFTLINFGVVVALLIFVWRRIVLPQLYIHYQITHDAHQKMRTRFQETQTSLAELESVVETDERFYKDMHEKIKHWQYVYLEKERLQAEMVKLQSNKLNKDREQQQLEFEKMTFMKEIAQDASREASSELQRYFVSKDHQQQFIHAALRALERNTHE